MKPILQHRWQPHGDRIVYYGLRNAPNTFKNVVRLSGKTIKTLSDMDGGKDLSEYNNRFALRRLIRKGILVDALELRKTPESLDEARFCVSCVANDFMIPGLEFDDRGRCPLCQNRKKDKNLISFLPVRQKIGKSKTSFYDAAVFYTGGKDSTYLLYYLAKVLKLKILALTWKIPYMSNNALRSIENAKKRLPEVDFIVKEAEKSSLNAIYAEHFRLAGNSCLCPSVAYILFYPLLVEKKVPFLILGNEPVQLKNLLYNQVCPRFVFKKGTAKLLDGAVNACRILTFRKPYRPGQFEMLTLVKGLAYGIKWGKNPYGRYQNESSQNARAAICAAPTEFMSEFLSAVKNSGADNIPALVHIDFNATFANGIYDWMAVKKIVSEELDWQDSPVGNKALHTSCRIEKCKESTQLERFRAMQSRIIPFSAIEISLAVSDCCLSREQAIEEIRSSTGFCCPCAEEYADMLEGFQKTTEK